MTISQQFENTEGLTLTNQTKYCTKITNVIKTSEFY